MKVRTEKKLREKVLIIGFLIILTSCTQNIGEFSLVSTGTPQYAQMAKVPTTKRIKASDGRFTVLFIPLGEKPSIKEAVNKCLDKGKGDFLERVRFKESYYNYILFSYKKYTVTGDVGNSKHNFDKNNE